MLIELSRDFQHLTKLSELASEPYWPGRKDNCNEYIDLIGIQALESEINLFCEWCEQVYIDVVDIRDKWALVIDKDGYPGATVNKLFGLEIRNLLYFLSSYDVELYTKMHASIIKIEEVCP